MPLLRIDVPVEDPEQHTCRGSAFLLQPAVNCTFSRRTSGYIARTPPECRTAHNSLEAHVKPQQLSIGSVSSRLLDGVQAGADLLDIRLKAVPHAGVSADAGRRHGARATMADGLRMAPRRLRSRRRLRRLSGEHSECCPEAAPVGRHCVSREIFVTNEISLRHP